MPASCNPCISCDPFGSRQQLPVPAAVTLLNDGMVSAAPWTTAVARHAFICPCLPETKCHYASLEVAMFLVMVQPHSRRWQVLSARCRRCLRTLALQDKLIDPSSVTHLFKVCLRILLELHIAARI